MENILGENIRRLRKTHKLTQKDLGKIAGVEYNTISDYENGNVIPSNQVLIKISNFFGVSTDDLLGVSKGYEDVSVEWKILVKKLIKTGYTPERVMKTLNAYEELSKHFK